MIDVKSGANYNSGFPVLGNPSVFICPPPRPDPYTSQDLYNPVYEELSNGECWRIYRGSSARVELLARSVFKHEAIFFFAFLDHIFLSVDNIKIACERFLVASSAGVSASFLFRVFDCPVSSSLVVPLFYSSYPYHMYE
jgi:hypothetical protein